MKKHEEKYEHGRFFVRPDIDSHDAVQQFIKKCRFLDTNAFESVHVTNRRNKLFRVNLNGYPRPLMLKINWINPKLSFRRRAALYANNRFKNYPRRGLAGAMALEKAAVPGIWAVAYWNYKPRTMQECGYFLYEEVDAECSIAEYQLFARRDANSRQQQVFNVLVKKTAELVHQLHESCLRHGSIELGNFLVNFACGMDAVDASAASGARLYLIDTDRITHSRVRNSTIKRIFDVRDLCRISFDRQGREYLLRSYLKDDYSDFWQRVLETWYTWHVGAKREHRETRPDLAQPRP